ncbi:MAG TPA: hypothetical protein VL361_16135 [Candidatus Limnocylindrales bacterium]|nr:hypothetical protein [Candidatus Limnocylindrales bacterium]
MKLRSPAVIGLVLIVLFGAACNLRAESDAQKSANEARRTLRQQGFKTDLSDFDFSTDHETAIRAATLTNFFAYPRPTVLLQPCGTDSAIVAWKNAALEEEAGYQNLPPTEQILATNQTRLDAACAAALAGPIRFPLDARQGSALLLVHLAALRNFSEALAARTIVELREQRNDAAWTNLLALTCLATGWEPEPSDISHLVRFNLARTAWKAAWQALQARTWTEEQFLALQREWEAPDFFKGLPETMAFTRAATVDTCIRERAMPAPGIPLKETLDKALHSPGSLAADAKYLWERTQYRTVGTYEDEHDLLVFFRDRELELRKAITASTWSAMRMLPGVTNTAPFQSKHISSMQAMLNTRQLTRSFQSDGKGLFGRAAETEARRRLIIVAIALERYCLAHGSYPKGLQSLVPDLLSSVPVDFMDGKPLRYRLSNSKTFVVYSVGLDCFDDGGKLSIAKNTQREFPKSDPFDGPDMIWPRAASDAEAQTLRGEQAQAKQELRRKSQEEEEQGEKEAEARRQEIIAELSEIYAKGRTPKIADPKIEGGLVSQVLRNKTLTGPPLRLDQLLTLRQVPTGKEPDTATFEVPISYDALTNTGTLRLLCDADPNETFSDEAPYLQECERATNGNCLLVWNTTYDPPGKHFLQAELSIHSWRTGPRRRNQDPQETTLKGPLFSFVSTNLLQFLGLGNVYGEKGAFFRAKLAKPVGSYSIEITSPSGERIHSITGSTTNGFVKVHWDLICDGGKRYTNESFNSTWNITFPEHPAASTNAP